MRPVFADPKTDYVFIRIFGTEGHKDLTVALLNNLLSLDKAHRISDVEFLPPERWPSVTEMKHAIVGVKCRDARGVHYIVEMQVLNVEGFEKRVVYNVAKAYTGQLGHGQHYPELDDVIGISICDFELWPEREGFHVPMLSRWRMQEQHGGVTGLPQLQFVFLELPKYDASRPPATVPEKWAYFFREAEDLAMVPEVLSERPYVGALDAARVAGFTEAEWELYLRTLIELQDERGRLTFADKQGEARGFSKGKEEGKEEGEAKGRREAIETACDLLQIELTAERRATLAELDATGLLGLLTRLRTSRRWE